MYPSNLPTGYLPLYPPPMHVCIIIIIQYRIGMTQLRVRQIPDRHRYSGSGSHRHGHVCSRLSLFLSFLSPPPTPPPPSLSPSLSFLHPPPKNQRTNQSPIHGMKASFAAQRHTAATTSECGERRNAPCGVSVCAGGREIWRGVMHA